MHNVHFLLIVQQPMGQQQSNANLGDLNAYRMVKIVLQNQIAQIIRPK